jgi:putative ABC transport system substrate-binding protein
MRRPGRWFTPALPALLLLLAAGLVPAGARAGTVVVLRSRALAAYDSAAAGFRSVHSGPLLDLVLQDREPALLRREIAAVAPDAIVAIGLKAALFAREQFPRTPLVHCAVQGPARDELSGVWVTGVSTELPAALALQGLHAAIPEARRVAVFYGARTGVAFARSAHRAASAIGIELVKVPIDDLRDFAEVAQRVADQADVLWMPADAAIAAPEPFRFLLELSIRRSKPLFVFSDALVRQGALAAVIPDYAFSGVQAAAAVRRIQAGERPGDIAVATVSHTRLVVNRLTAKALGHDVPPALWRVAEVVP